MESKVEAMIERALDKLRLAVDRQDLHAIQCATTALDSLGRLLGQTQQLSHR